MASSEIRSTVTVAPLSAARGKTTGKTSGLVVTSVVRPGDVGNSASAISAVIPVDRGTRTVITGFSTADPSVARPGMVRTTARVG